MLAIKMRNKLTEAKKNHDRDIASVYSLMIARILNEEKSGKYPQGTEIPDEVVVSLVQKEIKEMEETKSYMKPESEDYATLSAQIKELSQYLPPELSEDEVISIIKDVIASGETNMGKIIGATVKKVSNSFDKSKIAGLVKRVLG